MGFLAAVLWLLAGWGSLAGVSAPAPVLVHSNGVVECPAGAFAGGHRAPGQRVRYDFGLPPVPPVRRFLWEDVPVLQTEWEWRGVRYTQRVLVTRLDGGPLDGLSGDAVLLIQIAGDNLAQEYTNAAASLAVDTGAEPWPLELRGGWVYRAPGGAPTPLGFLDIPSVGIESTNGARLRFYGHMPPGNSGAMTLALPRQALPAERLASALPDLDFNETLHRVRTFWRSPAGRQTRPPLAWGEAPSTPAGPPGKAP